MERCEKSSTNSDIVMFGFRENEITVCIGDRWLFESLLELLWLW